MELKKEISNQYLHSVHKGGLDYVKNVLNRNDIIKDEDKKKKKKSIKNDKQEDETPINYVNPYDEMIKDAENMIKQYINQYEYDIDYEFDVISEDDIKDEKIKNEIISLYKSIDEYKEQKILLIINLMYIINKIKKGIHQTIYYIFLINIK